MARRRRRPPPAVSQGAVPAELMAGPVIETWLSPNEVPPVQRGISLAVLAEVKRRYERARNEWAAANGVAREDVLRLLPNRRPSFEDPIRQAAAFGPCSAGEITDE